MDISFASAAAVLPEITADLQAANEPVTERWIRHNGREFEYAYRCDANPAKAEEVATAHRKRIDYMASPSVQMISRTEWSVKWWSVD